MRRIDFYTDEDVNGLAIRIARNLGVRKNSFAMPSSMDMLWLQATSDTLPRCSKSGWQLVAIIRVLYSSILTITRAVN
jgi:hypothetical protein